MAVEDHGRTYHGANDTEKKLFMFLDVVELALCGRK